LSRVWFTSDLHIGHGLVAGLRGFASTGIHDDALATAWDATVAPEDTVWVLGDISAGGSTGQRNALAWIAQRNGTKHLVAGNHDGIHPHNRDAAKWAQAYAEPFGFVGSGARRRVNGTEVLLSHFPFDGDHTGISRYDQWRLRDCGVPVLHGHTHSARQLGHSATGTLQVHVGVDAHGLAPVSLDWVTKVIGE